MQIKQAQLNMRYAYLAGSLGVLVSGIVWLISGVVAVSVGHHASMAALFIGGMFIHPLSMLLAKILKRPGNHEKGNPLGALAIEVTIILMLGIVMAFAISIHNLNWFFPAMLLVIGGRYFVFSTLYGMRIYWVLGAILALTGLLLALINLPFVYGAFMGAIIEIAFAALIFSANKKLELVTA